MGSGNNGEFGLEQRNGNFLNCQSSGSYSEMSLVPICDMKSNPCSSSSSYVVESFFSTSWDPLAAMAAHHQGDIFPFNNLSGPENQVTDDGHSHLECSRLLSLGSGNFPDIVSSFGLSSLTDNNVYHPNYPKHDECHIEKSSASARSGSMGPIGGTKVADHEEINQDDKINSDNGKKLRMPDYHFDKFQGTATEKLKDVSDTSSEGLEERDKKKHKIEQGPDVNPKEDYIHVRARRGQATNSHSLAERVRRGKISERMKFLQDIVPGCNKITGKAVMLDEIINYVQSLQRQVEFLSMKLATVNPELNFDIERIHSKDILNSRGGSLDFLRLAPGIGSPPHFLQSQQGNMHEKMVIQSLDNSGEVLKGTNPQFSTITQISGVWDDELQKIVQQTGFSPNAPPNNAELHGRMKPEL